MTPELQGQMQLLAKDIQKNCLKDKVILLMPAEITEMCSLS
jgi:hypothetical protein